MNNIQPFKSSPLRRQVGSSSPSPTKTPSKSSDERMKFVSPKPTELQNLQLFNLKKNHFLSSPLKENEPTARRNDLTNMIDPSHQAQDIMENTNIFKKKRRVTFQNSPSKKEPKPVIDHPNFLYDEEEEVDIQPSMQETQLFPNQFDESVVMDQTQIMEETNLMQPQQSVMMEETHLLPPNQRIHMMQLDAQNSAIMEETRLVQQEQSHIMEETRILPPQESVLMEETKIINNPQNNSILEETDLITKPLVPHNATQTFNLDEYVNLHNKKGPLEQPMPSHFLNSLISEDTTTILKPVVETSSFFKKIEPTDFYSPSAQGSPINKINSDEEQDDPASLLNDTSLNLQQSPSPATKQPSPESSSLSLLPFPLPTTNPEPEILKMSFVAQHPSELTKEALMSQIQSNICLFNQKHLFSQSKYDQIFYNLDFSKLSKSSLFNDFNHSDPQEQRYLMNMINNTKEYCHLHCQTLNKQEMLPILEQQEIIFQHALNEYKVHTTQLSNALSEMVQLEQSLDSQIIQQRQEFNEQSQGVLEHQTQMKSFETQVGVKINNLYAQIDKQEQEILVKEQKLEEIKYSLKMQFSANEEMRQNVSNLAQQKNQLQVVESSDITALVQQQQDIKDSWGWEVNNITSLEVQLTFQNSFKIHLHYLEHYTKENINEALQIEIKVYKRLI